MARKSKPTDAVDMDLVAEAIAKAVDDGDFVNFRLLFTSFSPAREDSTEALDSSKYAYLLPDEAQRGAEWFAKALEAVRAPETWAHIERELQANRPAQLPSELLLMLADNAVRCGRYTSAAQAYELLRIRRSTQEAFFAHGLEALRAGDVPKAVYAFRIGVGLAYDYAAFPEPLPMVPNYQEDALLMHGTYPTQPEDCVALLPPEAHVQAALDFLLYDDEAAGRLRDVSPEQRLAFLKELVRQLDPNWDEFVQRYEDACEKTQALGERLRRLGAQQAETLEDVIEEQQAEDPWEVTRALLGRDIPGGEWWQYLKELAYEHPAAVLFIARQLVGDQEILMPRLRAGSNVPQELGLATTLAEKAVSEAPA